MRQPNQPNLTTLKFRASQDCAISRLRETRRAKQNTSSSTQNGCLNPILAQQCDSTKHWLVKNSIRSRRLIGIVRPMKNLIILTLWYVDLRTEVFLRPPQSTHWASTYIRQTWFQHPWFFPKLEVHFSCSLELNENSIENLQYDNKKERVQYLPMKLLPLLPSNSNLILHRHSRKHFLGFLAPLSPLQSSNGCICFHWSTSSNTCKWLSYKHFFKYLLISQYWRKKSKCLM